MRKVLILGYFKNNLGDDLFIYTLARSLPDTSFILIAPPSYRQFAKEKNTLWINSDFFLFVLLSKFLNLFVTIGRKLKFTDRINIVREHLIAGILSPMINDTVYISGSVFMESENNDDMSAKLQLDKWLFNRKPYVLGINFGPYKTETFLQSSIGLLNQAKLVTLRDMYSYSLLRDRLATEPMYSPDLAFAYDERGGTRTSAENDYYFISVINLESNGKDPDTIRQYEDLIVSLVDEITSGNEKVVLGGFCETLGDNLAIDRIMDRVTSKELCRVINYPESSFDELISEISNAKGVIATRHHSMILALKYSRPLYTISYNQKMTYTLQDLEIPESAYVFIDDLQNVNPKMILKSMYKAENEKVELWESKSKDVFRVLGNALNSDK